MSTLPRSLYVLASGAFALIATELGVIPLLPAVSKGLHVSISQAGWLLSAFALSVAVAGPWVTLAFARFERKRCLCFVLGVFVSSNLASMVVTDFAWLLALRVIPAFVHPVFWSLAMSAAGESVGKASAPRAVSVVFAGMSAGIVLGIPLAALVSAAGGWRMAFGFLAALNAAALVAHLTLLPRMPPGQARSVRSQVGILRRAGVWAALTLQVLLTAGAFAVYGFIAPFLQDVTRVGGAMVSVGLFVFGGVGVAGTLLAGRALSRDMDATIARFVPALMMLFLVLWVFGARVDAMVLLVPLWGLAHAFVVPASQAVVLRSSPDTPEFSNALFNSFGNIGITLGTLCGGAVVSTFGLANLPSAGVVFLGMALGLVAAHRVVQRRAATCLLP